MRLSEFLLIVKKSSGVGLKSEYLLYQALKSFSDSEIECLDATAIIEILKIPKSRQARFTSSFNEQRSLAKQGKLNYDNWLSITDDSYPNQLRESYLPPIGFFYQGNLDLLKTPMLGVVGSRTATDYSRNVLSQIVPDLLLHNLTIVSGLARGVDSLAHRISLANGGKTIAVIGTGIGRYYPSENRKLQEHIGKHQLLISEYPESMGPMQHHFPERNRIIAGLCQGVLVTEAKSHSGSLITANLALQNNREVFAIPGPINAQMSVGTNELILAGAKPILAAEHVIEELLC